MRDCGKIKVRDNRTPSGFIVKSAIENGGAFYGTI